MLRFIGMALVVANALGLAALAALNERASRQDPYFHDTYFVLASPVLLYTPGLFGIALIASSIALRPRS
jgi:uncharacterized membrane protein YdcZ (DUF606 family)